MEELEEVKKRGRDESDSAEFDDSDSPEVKRLRENLLDGLDDEGEFRAESRDLDSFMRSFAEEIAASPSPAVGGAAVVVDLASECSDSLSDLGYLLGASDYELGLPPPTSSPARSGIELARVESESVLGGDEFWEIPCHDSFGFGESDFNGVALDGLFDYSDVGFGSADFAFRPETLPAQ